VNEVRLGGWFATEVSLCRDERGAESASFLIRVVRTEGGEDYFRIICEANAAAVVAAAAENRLLMGTSVLVRGRLAQETVTDQDGHEIKMVRVRADEAWVGDREPGLGPHV
jgi:hypothetical protein